MRALIHDPQAKRGIRLADGVPAPVPTASQALVEIHAISLNFGETAYIDQTRKPGEIPGWDAAGVVVEAAADGSGPAVGTRVTTFGWQGAWAELRAVETTELAAVPDAVGLAEASALPVAAVTALQALRELGPIVGRRVLVTGASGGVGRFAVQLAARAGAHVVAAVGSTARGQGLTELGADEVVVGLDGVSEPVFGVLDNVGGPLLAQAYSLLESGGSVQAIGKASLEATTIDFEAVRRLGGPRKIETFHVTTPFAPDLAYLLSLLEKKELDPQIGLRDSWERASEAAEALLTRQIKGKAVLDTRPS